MSRYVSHPEGPKLGSVGEDTAREEKTRCAINEKARKLPRVGYGNEAVRRIENDIEGIDGVVCPARARKASNETESSIQTELTSAAKGRNEFGAKSGIEKCRWE
jgi:hypothetical protein